MKTHHKIYVLNVFFFLSFSLLFIRSQHLEGNVWATSGKVQRRAGGRRMHLKSLGPFAQNSCLAQRDLNFFWRSSCFHSEAVGSPAAFND